MARSGRLRTEGTAGLRQGVGVSWTKEDPSGSGKSMS